MKARAMKPGKPENYLLINISFAGLCDSIYSSGLDYEEESFCEYEAEKESSEYETEALRIDAREYADIVYHVADYNAMHKLVAAQYSEAFNATVKANCDIDLRIVHESMESPREYNFTTDRIFCYIPKSIVKKLFKLTSKEALADRIKANHTSYDGFCSFYSNDLATWQEKPVIEWDFNELGTLLQAYLSDKLPRDWNIDTYENIDFHSIFESSVDWQAYEAKVAELRAEKLEADMFKKDDNAH